MKPKLNSLGFVNVKQTFNDENWMMRPQLMFNDDLFVILVYLYGVNKDTCKEKDIKVEYHNCK